MAITATQLTSGYSIWNSPPFVTASITPAANKLILLTVWAFAQTAATPFFSPTSITGNGLTWTLIGYQDYFPDGAGSPTLNLHSRVAVYRAVGASPTAGTISIAYTGTQPDGCAWSVTEITGADVTGTNGANAIVQYVTKQAAPTWPAPSLSITLAALGNAANATFGAFGGPWDGSGAAIALSTGSGYTQLSAGGENWLYWMNEIKLAGSTTVNVSSSPSAESIGGIAIEIKAAGSGTSVALTGNAIASSMGSVTVSGATPRITATQKMSGSEWVNASSFVTASVTPTANKLQLFSVSYLCASGGLVVVPTVTGCGLTWVEVAHVDHWGSQGRTTVFKAVGASPTAGSLTIATTTPLATCAWSLAELNNVDVSSSAANSIIQSAVANANNVNTISATLAPFSGVMNATFGVFAAASVAGSPGSVTTVAGSGFALLSSTGQEWANIGTEWRNDNDRTVDATFNATVDYCGVIALELKSATPNVTLGILGNSVFGSAGNISGSAQYANPMIPITGFGITASAGVLSKSTKLATTFRNPYLQPFAANSIWNMPIGSGARYVAANLAAPVDPNNSADTQWAPFPMADTEVIVMTPDAPAVAVNYSSAGWGSASRCGATGGLLQTVQVPNSYVVPNNNENGSAAFLGADRRTVQQNQPFTRCSAGGSATAYVTFNNEDFYGFGAWGAHGGSQLSALGGSIRVGELRPGQRGPTHALKVTIYARQFLYKGTSQAQCYRWPALTADGYAVGFYGAGSNAVNNNNPDMVMGSLLAIPPTISIASLNLESEPAKQLAWTLQNYGAYVVDDSYGPAWLWNIEGGYAGSKAAEFQSDYGFAFAQRIIENTAWTRDHLKLMAALRCVANNSSTNVGGGGTPLQPLAAPFSPTVEAESHGFSASASLLNLAVPQGVIVGDLLLASICFSGNVGISTPAGWNLIASSQSGANGTDSKQATFWLAATTWQSTYTWNFSAATPCNGTIWRIINADLGSPIHAFSTNSGTGTTPTGKSITTSINNTLLCLRMSNRSNPTNWPAPTYWNANSVVRSNAEQSVGCSASFYDIAATGNIATSTNGSSGDKWTAQLLAIAPNSGGIPIDTNPSPTPQSVTVNPILSGSDYNDLSAYVTSSYTPKPVTLLLLSVVTVYSASGTPVSPTVTGNGLTWVEVRGVNYWSANGRLTVFRAMGAAPTVGSITITAPATLTTCAWSLSECTGIDVSGSNGANAIVQSASASATSVTSLTVHLATFANANNAAFGAFSASGLAGEAGSIAIAPGGGYTQLHSIGEEWANIGTEWRPTEDVNVDMLLNASTDFVGGIAIELKAAATGTSLGITGNTLNSAAGLPAAAMSKSITGFSITGAVGTLGTSKGKSIAITGNTITSGLGQATALPYKYVAITGNSTQCVAGAVSTKSSSVTLGLTGNSITASVGVLGKIVAKGIAGNSVTATKGALVDSNSKSVAITGNSITTSLGDVKKFTPAPRPYVFVLT